MQEQQTQAVNKKAVMLIVLIVVAAAAVILAATLSIRAVSGGPQAYEKPLKPNTIVYTPITEVETARKLVVHPYAELHGFRFRAEDTIAGVYVYIETWRNGEFLENSGGMILLKDDLQHGEGRILFSYGLRADKKAVDWCLGASSGGGGAMFSQPLPEDLIPAAWMSGARQQSTVNTPVPITIEKETPFVLAVMAISENGSMRGLSLDGIADDSAKLKELILEYDYIQLLKCQFYERADWPSGEVFLSVWQDGVAKGAVDATQLPARLAAENAAKQFALRSAAWPGRDIRTLPQAIGLSIKQPTLENGDIVMEYFAFRLEDGTPVLQSQSAMQFSVIEEETYIALLEGVAVVGLPG